MDETLMVSLDAKDGVTQRCQREGCTNAATKKFCSSACRQAAYRTSEAHKAILARDKEWRNARRRAYHAVQRRDIFYCALQNGQSYGGPSSSQKFKRGDKGRFGYKLNGERIETEVLIEMAAHKPPAEKEFRREEFREFFRRVS